MTGSGTLIKTGSGWFTLTGANSYTGGTLVQSGTLELAGQGVNVLTGTANVQGGTLLLSNPWAAANCTVAVNSDGGLTFDPLLGGQATVGGLSGGQNFSLNDSGGTPVGLTVG